MVEGSRGQGNLLSDAINGSAAVHLDEFFVKVFNS
jgi:hypothetical protein